MNIFKGVTLRSFLMTFFTVYVPLFAFIFGEGVIVKVIQLLSDLFNLDRLGAFGLAWGLFVAGGIIWGAIEFKGTKVGQKFPDPMLNGITWLLTRKPIAIKVLAYVGSTLLLGAVTVPPLKSANFWHMRSLAILTSIVYAFVWVPSFFAVPIPGIK